MPTGEDTSATGSSDCSTPDEGIGVGRGGADNGANFENDDLGDEHPFAGVVGVDAAKGELDDAEGEQEAGFVPGDVAEGLEFVGDGWDGGA